MIPKPYVMFGKLVGDEFYCCPICFDPKFQVKGKTKVKAGANIKQKPAEPDRLLSGSSRTKEQNRRTWTKRTAPDLTEYNRGRSPFDLGTILEESKGGGTASEPIPGTHHCSIVRTHFLQKSECFLRRDFQLIRQI